MGRLGGAVPGGDTVEDFAPEGDAVNDSSAPKGHRKAAQGIALWTDRPMDYKRCKGGTNGACDGSRGPDIALRREGLVPPLQGLGSMFSPASRALPWAGLWLPLRGESIHGVVARDQCRARPFRPGCATVAP
jgi:hypothetical protein